MTLAGTPAALNEVSSYVFCCNNQETQQRNTKKTHSEHSNMTSVQKVATTSHQDPSPYKLQHKSALDKRIHDEKEHRERQQLESKQTRLNEYLRSLEKALVEARLAQRIHLEKECPRDLQDDIVKELREAGYTCSPVSIPVYCDCCFERESCDYCRAGPTPAVHITLYQ